MIIEHIEKDIINFRDKIKTGEAYKPLSVKLKLIWNCNLRCFMCNHWRIHKKDTMNIDFLKKIIKQLSDLECKRIHLTGGEPFLFPKLIDLISYAKNNYIKVTMTTNGTLINEKNAYNAINNGLKKVFVSIDSPDPRIHDSIRGVEGSWNKTINGFKILRKLLGKGKLGINTVVCSLNYKSSKEFPDFAINIGADFINFMPLEGEGNKIFGLKKDQILEYNSSVIPFISEKLLLNNLISDYKECFIYGITDLEIENSIKNKYAQGYYNRNICFVPWTHMLIDENGRVHICCKLKNQPIIGDLKNSELKSIWNSSMYVNFRKNQRMPISTICEGCIMFINKNREIDNILFLKH